LKCKTPFLNLSLFLALTTLDLALPIALKTDNTRKAPDQTRIPLLALATAHNHKDALEALTLATETTTTMEAIEIMTVLSVVSEETILLKLAMLILMTTEVPALIPQKMTDITGMMTEALPERMSGAQEARRTDISARTAEEKIEASVPTKIGIVQTIPEEMTVADAMMVAEGTIAAMMIIVLPPLLLRIDGVMTAETTIAGETTTIAGEVAVVEALTMAEETTEDEMIATAPAEVATATIRQTDATTAKTEEIQRSATVNTTITQTPRCSLPPLPVICTKSATLTCI
jgi:hypothetical protein